MFKKVLVVEDLDSIGFGITQMLEQDTAIETVQKCLYCDDAYLKFLKAQQDSVPYDLVITDLSFKADHRNNILNSGDELVHALKLKQPNLKTIIYSVEERSVKVKTLFNNFKIDAYVVKGRNGLKNLADAINALAKNKTYTSPELQGFMNKKEIFEIEDYDIMLLSHLSQGFSQEEITTLFKQKKIKPNSLSTIEKRLNRLKVELNAKNVVQMIAMVKDLGWV